MYNKYLLFIAGLGGLLYGIDVGVIAGALPYLEATRGYTPGQLSTVAAAVLGGSVLSSFIAGSLAEWMGRKKLMIIAGILFVLSVPVICIPTAYIWLVLGRILQGAAAGLIGVVVPLYLAECLTPDKRGFGTGMFQFMLTVGLVFAAIIGLLAANYVDNTVAAKGDVFAAMDFAWKLIFWVCAIPGVIFSVGAVFLSDSARWLHKKGKVEACLAALIRSRGEEQAKVELAEMDATAKNASAETDSVATVKDSIFQKKYITPFILAVIILACTQATGINSVLAYIVNVLRQAGLEGAIANQGDIIVKVLNMGVTLLAMILVDKMGRKFLLTIGTAGIIIGLLGVAVLFLRSENKLVDQVDQFKNVEYRLLNQEEDEVVAGSKTGKKINVDYAFKYTFADVANKEASQIRFVYRLDGKKKMETYVVRPCPVTLPTLTEGMSITEEYTKAKDQFNEWMDSVTVKVKYDKTDDGSGYKNEVPFEIESIQVGPVPSPTNGWLVTFFFVVFISFYAIGPGVCVWLALSELMPNRIRAVGMSVAMLINQAVSYTLAQSFLPAVSVVGYAPIFFLCAGCTVIYFIAVAFFLPETKGRTLEEIEAHFSGTKKLS